MPKVLNQIDQSKAGYLFASLWLRMRLWWLLALVVGVACVPQYELETLLSFKNTSCLLPLGCVLGGWFNGSDPCNGWFGVTCNMDNTSVEQLTLPLNYLVGNFSDLVLPGLKHLYVPNP